MVDVRCSCEEYLKKKNIDVLMKIFRRLCHRKAPCFYSVHCLSNCIGMYAVYGHELNLCR